MMGQHLQEECFRAMKLLPSSQQCPAHSNLGCGSDSLDEITDNSVCVSFVLGSAMPLGQILNAGHVVYTNFAETITQFHFSPSIPFLSLKLFTASPLTQAYLHFF